MTNTDWKIQISLKNGKNNLMVLHYSDNNLILLKIKIIVLYVKKFPNSLSWNYAELRLLNKCYLRSQLNLKIETDNIRIRRLEKYDFRETTTPSWKSY